MIRGQCTVNTKRFKDTEVSRFGDALSKLCTRRGVGRRSVCPNPSMCSGYSTALPVRDHISAHRPNATSTAATAPARRLSQDVKTLSHCTLIHNCRGKRISSTQKNTIKPPEKTDSPIA